MPAKVLIVEDEIFVAVDLEATLQEIGYRPVGIAPDTETALALIERRPDIALVDLNLRDGPTGPGIGRKLSEEGVAVLFVTANPLQLGDGIPGTVGVITKPMDRDLVIAALNYVMERLRGVDTPPPSGLSAFR